MGPRHQRCWYAPVADRALGDARSADAGTAVVDVLRGGDDVEVLVGLDVEV
jgi:hypothetical protein